MGCCLNNVLQGCALNEIDGVVVSKLQAELKEYQELLQPILKAIEIYDAVGGKGTGSHERCQEYAGVPRIFRISRRQNL